MLAASGPGRFDAEVSSEWTIDGKPNGGYLLAMLGGAAGRCVPMATPSLPARTTYTRRTLGRSSSRRSYCERGVPARYVPD
jgi:hypothetical protein